VTPATVAELRVGDRVAHYRIVELIGRGAVGVVYRAVDEQQNREVALKLLAPDVDDVGDDSQLRRDAARRLVREARAAAAFTHPNAVTLYDVGVVDNAPYVAMELVHGQTLRTKVGDASVPLGERLRWLSDVAGALAAAHKAGLVHRDVKPDNVIVGDDGVVKLLDFGVARRVPRADPSGPTASTDGAITIDGALVGTPAYMSPEQLRGETVDGRADQFSWAVMAYELIAGRKPWSAPSAPLLIAAIIGREPDWLTAEGVPRHVAATVMRALSKAADDRFRTMNLLLEALAGRARPRPEWGRMGRAVRLPLAFGALFATAALGAWGLARHAARQEGEAAAKANLPRGGVTVEAQAVTRYPCPPAPRRDDGAPACADGHGWCDASGHQLACCPEGLVATGRDGGCACPPGGIADRPGCAAPSRTGVDYVNGYLPTALRRAYATCDVPAGPDPLALDVWIDPDGRVFDAQILEAYTADARLQRCVVERLRAATVEAPLGGSARVSFGRR
jgi:serine/threonine-protein kinase